MSAGPASERELFDRALGLSEEERRRFLDTACPDPGVRHRVEALLGAHDRAGDGFLGRPAAELVAGAAGRAGRRLGPYEIVKELGHGGMGVVYLARRADDEFQKSVAIKIVAAPLGDEGVLRRFRRERQILAGLEHPFIARLLDGGTTEEGLPYLVMEFVEGTRLDEYCRAQALDIAARLRLFQQVCRAVQHAHASLVIHSDLKPQNILVTADGQPKLLDFGIARLLQDDGSSASESTLTGLAALTPEYASPEQLRGERITTASDVYSLGVLLYELLSGERPYDFGSRRADEVFAAVTTQEPRRPSAVAAARGERTLARQLRGDLDTIVGTAMHKDPARRYSSVASLADDLSRHLEGLPVSARADSAAYRFRRFVGRHRAASAAVAAVILTLVAGIIATGWQARLAERQRREAEFQRARAERRFADVRRLANSVLFELHDTIAPLAGSTAARQLVVTRGLEYLDSLGAEAAGDRALQVELAAAYDRVGDVQGSQSMANLGDADGALRSYGKAEAIRKALAAEAPDAADAQAWLATSDMKIGDALIGRGAVADAVARYRAALGRREHAHAANWPSAYDAKLAVAEAVARLCTTLAAVGDVQGAMASCRRNLELADQLLAERPDARNLRVMRAANVTSQGNLLRMTRAFGESAALLEDGVQQYRDLIASGRPDQELQRRLAVAYGYLASVRLELKDPVAAAETFRLSTTELEALAVADASNVRPRIELAYMLNRRAQVLTGLGRTAEAHRDARRALTVLREAADRPGVGGEVLNEYAWTLVSTEPVELRDPARALQFVDRAIARAASPNAMFLHTRAWALYRLGRVDEAVAELDRALQLLPAQGASVGLKRQIEATRASFRR